MLLSYNNQFFKWLQQVKQNDFEQKEIGDGYLLTCLLGNNLMLFYEFGIVKEF